MTCVTCGAKAAITYIAADGTIYDPLCGQCIAKMPLPGVPK